MSRAEKSSWLQKVQRNARSRKALVVRPFDGASLERLEERTLMAFTPVATPTAAYTSGTTLIPITGPDTVVISSVSDASETVNFSQPMTTATVPLTYATWNTPPAVESATPRVVFNATATTETLTLSSATNTFGFELEPDSGGAGIPVTVSFFSGATLDGQISQAVNSVSGALLFAGTSTTPITSVGISESAPGAGWGLANFRYGPLVPQTTLSVTATAPTEVDQNQDLTFNLSITNTGANPAMGVTVTDPLPGGTTFVSETDPGAPWIVSTPAVGSGGTVTFSDATLAPGATANFTITVLNGATNAVGSTIVNSVSGTATNALTANATSNTTVESRFFTLNGTASDDILAVELDPTGTIDNFFLNNTFVGSQLLSTLDGINMNGGAGNDTFLVDYTNGNPIPSTAKLAGLNLDGGTGANQYDLQNGTETADSYMPGSNPGQGTQLVTVGGVQSLITFQNMSPVLDLLAGPATVVGSAANNQITYGPGTFIAGDGEVDVDNFESYEFSNKTTLTLDTGFGNDTVNISNNTTPAGLTAINVAGGSGVNQLVVNAFGNQPGFLTAGQITIPGQVPINYTGISAVQINNAPDQPLTTFPTTIAGTADAELNNVAIAAFVDGTPSGKASDFNAFINWGDGSNLSPGTILGNGSGGFFVVGSHTYTVAGSFTITASVTDLGSNGSVTVGGVPISVQDPGSATPTTISSTANIAQSALLLIGQPVLGVEGTPIPVGTLLATFTEANGPGPVGGYSATATIGGTSVPVAVSLVTGSVNTFQVLTTATYTPAEEGVLPVVVTVTNLSGPPTETSTTMTTAMIADAPLTAGAATLLAASTGVALPPTTVVGTFTDGNTAATTADFTDVIYWGDGSAPTTGVLVATGGGGFEVEGGHTYAKPGVYTTTIDVSDDGGSQVVLTGSVIVTDLPVTGATKTFTAVEGQSTGLFVLATFTDPNTLATVSDVQATLAVGGWGDGTPTAAGIALVVQQTGVNPANGDPTFEVLGSHTYAEETAAGLPDTLSVIITTSGGVTTTLTSPPGGGVTVLDAQLTGSAGNSITGVEGITTGTDLLGAFTDANQGATVADYTAGGGSVVVNWGDSSAPQTLTAANLTTIGSANGVTWTISAAHTYAEEGVYSYSITVTDDGGAATKVFGTSTIADAALVTPTGVAVTGTEGKALVNVPVLTFVDDNPLATIADFTATIDWGDGDQTSGLVTQPGGVGTPFTVTGDHTYAEEGSYAIHVDVLDDGGSRTSGNTTATIADAPLTAAAGISVNAVEGLPFTNVAVASFTDTNPGGSVGDFTATIDWGDGGPTSTGILVMVGGNSTGTIFDVLGSHTYSEEGTDPISVVITDAGGQTATINAATGNGASATVIDAPISGQGAFVQGVEGEGLSQTGGTTFGPVVIGTFTDSNPGATSADFTVAPGSITVNWGDGSAVETLTAANLTATQLPAGVLFTITDGHVYAEEGTYQVLITVADDGGSTAILHGEATIKDAPLTSSPTGTQPVVNTTESPIFPVPEFGAPIFTGPVGSFTDADPTSPVSDFKAVIFWGDNSSPSAGTISQPGGPGTPFIVTGSHTYADAGVNGGVGTYPITIYVGDVDGSGLTIQNTANVADIPIALTGILNPASDSGYSNTDDITDVKQPKFYGTSEPFSHVTLYATAPGGPAVLIGQATAAGDGSWKITSHVLADGKYLITAHAIDQFGKTTAGPVVITQKLVIDTVGPRVTGEVFDRLGGSVYLVYQDTNSGLNLTTILDAANYSLTKQKGSLPGRYVVTAANLIFNGGPTGGDIVQLQINGGAPIKGGFYLFTAFAKSVLMPSGIQDVAGNALDGEFYGPNTLSGNGVPGGNFVADLDAFHDIILPPATVIGSAQPNPIPASGFNTVKLVYVNGVLYGLPKPIVVPFALRGSAEQVVTKAPVLQANAVKTPVKVVH